jgi:uncharacterized protein involved in response to NO
MYGLIQVGALVRVVAGIAPPEWRNAALVFSGVCWSIAFGLFVLVYAPYLWRPRLDGKEG